MKLSILDPIHNEFLLLNVTQTDYEGTPALKVIFPEKDSITMIKKDGIWAAASETDISEELVEAISKGMQSYIEPNIQPNHLGQNTTKMQA